MKLNGSAGKMKENKRQKQAQLHQCCLIIKSTDQMKATGSSAPNITLHPIQVPAPLSPAPLRSGAESSAGTWTGECGVMRWRIAKGRREEKIIERNKYSEWA
jgi:hypothetical protein